MNGNAAPLMEKLLGRRSFVRVNPEVVSMGNYVFLSLSDPIIPATNHFSIAIRPLMHPNCIHHPCHVKPDAACLNSNIVPAVNQNGGDRQNNWIRQSRRPPLSKSVKKSPGPRGFLTGTVSVPTTVALRHAMILYSGTAHDYFIFLRNQEGG